MLFARGKGLSCYSTESIGFAQSSTGHVGGYMNTARHFAGSVQTFDGLTKYVNDASLRINAHTALCCD